MLGLHRPDEEVMAGGRYGRRQRGEGQNQKQQNTRNHPLHPSSPLWFTVESIADQFSFGIANRGMPCASRSSAMVARVSSGARAASDNACVDSPRAMRNALR